VSKESDQTEAASRKFKLGPLGSLNQVTKGLAKTILPRSACGRELPTARQLLDDVAGCNHH